MIKRLLSFVLVLSLAGCVATQPIPQNLIEDIYHLNIGDKIKLRVFDEPDMDGTYIVDSKGNIALPLVGKMPVSGQTEQQALQTITEAYRKGGYLRKPKIAMDVINMKPIFVLGEVNKPGTFDFQNGLTVYQAVALAGGYTYRADRDDVIIRRPNAAKPFGVKEDTAVMPGDTIEIGERFF